MQRPRRTPVPELKQYIVWNTHLLSCSWMHPRYGGRSDIMFFKLAWYIMTIQLYQYTNIFEIYYKRQDRNKSDHHCILHWESKETYHFCRMLERHYYQSHQTCQINWETEYPIPIYSFTFNGFCSCRIPNSGGELFLWFLKNDLSDFYSFLSFLSQTNLCFSPLDMLDTDWIAL